MVEIEQPPILLFIPATLFPEAEAFLRRHRCRIALDTFYSGDEIIARTTVTLPPDSIREETSRLTMIQYRIGLPDGITLREVYNPGTGTSALYIPAQRKQEGDDEQ